MALSGGARPAEPLLASAIVTGGELERLFDSVVGGVSVRERSEGVLRTGSKSVDGAFGGGLERGRVVGVWGDAGGGCAEIGLALLASCLLEDPRASAAVVDTVGNFDVLRLYSFLLARLQDDGEVLGAMNAGMGTQGMGAEDIAAKALDRVNIMRAFDLVGVMEAVGEVRDELEGRGLQGERRREDASVDGSRTDLPQKESHVEQELGSGLEKEMPKRTFVADSDDEEELLFDDEPVISTSTNNAALQPLRVDDKDEILFVDEPSDLRDDTLTSPAIATDTPLATTDITSTRPAFVLIDNLAHIISPMLQKDHAQAQALTSSFLLTLSHLTRNHNLYTILCNSSVAPRPTAKRPNPNQEKRPEPPPAPSIFSSNQHVPALMGLLLPYVDMSLLVERMPRRKADARAVYADGEAVMKVRRGIETVNAVEIMGDRYSDRDGGWGTFVCGDRGVKDI